MRAWLLVPAAAVALGAGAAAARDLTPTVAALTVSGHGFGQGIGLSQWGAQERARGGQSVSEILRFYYPGTDVGRTQVAEVRVLIMRAPRVTIGSSDGMTVRRAGAATVTASGHITFEADTGPYPIELASRTAPLTIDGTRYRGSVTLTRVGRRVQVVNDVSLDGYVGDVVSAECPGSWLPAALRSQAIASRSYAVANLRPTRAFDLYADNHSQNYRGMAREYPSAVAAAAATASQVLRFRGRIVNAYFSAANGGRTNDSLGAWDVAGVPYLVSRPDLFDARGPDTDWGPVRIPLGEVHRLLPEVPLHVTSVSVIRNDAGRARSLVFSTADGMTVAVDGYRFQQRLGLRSTYLSSVRVES